MKTVINAEQSVVNLLVTLGFTEQKDIGEFRKEGAARAIMVKRLPGSGAEIDHPVDVASMLVVVRDNHPKDANEFAKDVANKLHGITPTAVSDDEPNTNFLSSVTLTSGPDRDDDEELELHQFAMTFDMRFRVEET